ncbi:MAG: cysteine synthase family protein [Propionibacteriaceae bacterium]|jgi:cysteine synthase A|nr:cysteine synthase family protein [Propionibacteriaceae bacterium]
MIAHDVLAAVGGTPTVRLNRLVTADMAEVVVKLEGLNVGGSIKTRSAWHMIDQAIKRGRIKADTIICEPTSGNQGVGLALVAAVRGMRCVIVMPDSVSAERRQLIQAYGAQVISIHDQGDIGACIAQCLQTALALAAADPRVYVPQQFTNPDNPAIHESTTGRELVEQVGRPIDGFCAGVGTGGTLTGIGRRLRRHNPATVIWAVEPSRAAVLSGGPVASHLQMGIGDGLIPDNLDQSLYSQVAVVSDEEAMTTARRLAREEGLLAGVSGGSNVTAALRLAAQLGPGKLVATILPDTGERYFSTPLYDQPSD